MIQLYCKIHRYVAALLKLLRLSYAEAKKDKIVTVSHDFASDPRILRPELTDPAILV